LFDFIQEVLRAKVGFLSIPLRPVANENTKLSHNCEDALIELRDINKNKNEQILINQPVYPKLINFLPSFDRKSIHNTIDNDVKLLCQQQRLTMNDIIKMDWFENYEKNVKILLKTTIISRLTSNCISSRKQTFLHIPI
jgi:hypothetical protein